MKSPKSIEVIAAIVTALVIVAVLILPANAQVASTSSTGALVYGYPEPEKESGTRDSSCHDGQLKIANPDGEDTVVSFPNCDGHSSINRSLGPAAKNAEYPFGETELLYGVYVRLVDDEGNTILDTVTVCFPYDGGSPTIYVLAYNPAHWVAVGGAISGDQICASGLPGSYALFDS